MKKIVLFFTAQLMIAAVSFSQNMGIGTTTPTAKLEIKGDGASSATNALLVKNSNGDTLIRVKNSGLMNFNYNGISSGRTLNIGRTGANFFSDDEHFGGAVFPTDTSIVIWSQSEDTNYVILQPSWGKVGVGTYSPKAKFEVKGDFILGSGGSVLTRIVKATVTRDIGSIAAGTSTTQTFTVAGARTGSTVYISPDAALPDGLLIAYARVTANDAVEVKFRNVTTAAINPSSMEYYITVIQ